MLRNTAKLFGCSVSTHLYFSYETCCSVMTRWAMSAECNTAGPLSL